MVTHVVLPAVKDLVSAFKEKHNDLTMDTVDDLYGEFLPSLTLTARQQHAIEYRTRGQSKVPL